MPRLPRTKVPVEVCCRVLLNQLGEAWPDSVIDAHRRKLGGLKLELMARFAEQIGCAPDDLRLDHDPALGLRKKIKKHGVIVGYIPHEHSIPDLRYRDHHGHHIKTNVRGDGAQFSDTVLMKRERRREKKALGKRVPVRITFTDKPPTKWAKKSTWGKGRKIQSRGFDRGPR